MIQRRPVTRVCLSSPLRRTSAWGCQWLGPVAVDVLALSAYKFIHLCRRHTTCPRAVSRDSVVTFVNAVPRLSMQHYHICQCSITFVNAVSHLSMQHHVCVRPCNRSYAMMSGRIFPGFGLVSAQDVLLPRFPCADDL